MAFGGVGPLDFLGGGGGVADSFEQLQYYIRRLWLQYHFFFQKHHFSQAFHLGPKNCVIFTSYKKARPSP